MDSLENRNLHKWLSTQLSILKIKLIGEPASPPKLYRLGFWVIVLCFPASLLIALANTAHSVHIIYFFVLGGAAIWACAFGMEAAALVPKVIGNNYFLALLGLISILVVKVSSIWIGRFINETTGVDPSELPDAASALLIVFVPISWLYMTIALLTVTLFGMLTFGPLWSLVFHSKEQTLAFFARLIVTVFIVSYAFIFLDYVREESVEGGKIVILAAEYFSDGRCKNLDENEIAARLEGGLSIYNTSTEKFRFEDCQQ